MTIRVQRSAEQQTAAQAKQIEQAVAQDIRQAQADARQAQADARQAANDARQEAIQAAREQKASVAVSAGPDGFSKIIEVPDGNGGVTRIVIDKNGVVVGGGRQNFQSTRGQRDIPPNVMEIMKDFSIAACFIVLGYPMIRGFWRAIERRAAAAPSVQPEVLQRLAAIENAVESIAVEVERVSEGQRFTTKLLSERQQQPAEEFVVSGSHARLDRPRG